MLSSKAFRGVNKIFFNPKGEHLTCGRAAKSRHLNLSRSEASGEVNSSQQECNLVSFDPPVSPAPAVYQRSALRGLEVCVRKLDPQSTEKSMLFRQTEMFTLSL